MAEWQQHLFGDLLAFAIGGGWGNDEPVDGDLAVRVIRGADFPAAVLGDYSSLPLRFEPENKATRRTLRPGDIVLEISGGTKDRPTGRTVYVDSAALETADSPVIPASFCRLVRPDPKRLWPRFGYYLLQDLWNRGGTWEYQNQSTGLSNFQFEMFCRTYTPTLPPLDVQRAIAEVLGALDDKIAANTKLATTAELLAAAAHAEAVSAGSRTVALQDVTLLIARGITPSYSEEESDTTTVLGQRCVRTPRVEMAPARRTLNARLRPDKMLVHGDVLVNSTGMGSLGRVARWVRSEPATVDSHITIVRFDPSRVDAVAAGYSLLTMEAPIEAMAEGSTGQTELPRASLGSLEIQVPLSAGDKLAARLESLANVTEQAVAESERLAATRDTLLPALMSGKLRVRDAERIAEDPSSVPEALFDEG